MKKLFFNIETVFHTIFAILLFIFYKQLVEYVPYLVGLIMILYSIETLVPAFYKDSKHKDQRILEAVLLIFFAIIMMTLGSKNFATACVVWATWSIYREGMELVIVVKESNKLWVGILNALESVICIVFSFMLIAEPGEHHALVHVVLLGVELLGAVYFKIIDKIGIKESELKKEEE